ncbi:MAG TPA: hypothetical protein VKB95_04610, partial [Chitinophagaceae bacterium]|nr:hypothetical protein [Chitinophagaceae bacterium]
LKRAVTNKGLNFVIPPAFNTVGTYKYRLTTIANTVSGAPVACSNCLTHIVQDDQETVGNFRIRAIGLQYTSGNPAQTFAPVARDFNLLESWLQRAYPANAVNYSQATVPATATWPFNCGDANAQISAMRNLDIAGGTDKRTHYYALVSDGAGFMRGCAAIAGSPDPSAVGSGPTGPGTWGWDLDGSYGDWYGGHEIGHTLGRLHIGSGCGETSDDPSYPFTAGQLSNIDSMFLGFDVGDSRYAIPMAALPGTFWHDVMSYCANQWVSSYTYARMQTRINAENSLSPGASPFAGASPGSSSNFIFTKDTIPDFESMAAAYRGPSPIIEGLKEKPPIYTAMKEPVTKIQAAGRMPSFALLKPSKIFKEPKSSSCNQADILYGVYEKRKIPARDKVSVDPNEIVYNSPLTDSNFINLIATINITQVTGKISYTNKVNKAIVYNPDKQPSVLLRLFDDRNNLLREMKVAIRMNTDIEPGEDSTGIVDAMIPVHPAIKKIQLIFRDRILDTKTFTTNENLVKLSDSARIESKRIIANENRKSGYLVSWDHKALTNNTIYHVQISTDNGQSWQTIGFGLKSKNFLVEDNLLNNQRNVLIKILANEGLETVEIGKTNIRKE